MGVRILISFLVPVKCKGPFRFAFSSFAGLLLGRLFNSLSIPVVCISISSPSALSYTYCITER